MAAKRKKEPTQPARVDGPSSLEEVLSLPSKYGELLGRAPHRAALSDVLDRGIFVTSGYSGTGGFELAVDAVVTAAGVSLDKVPNIVYYSACDSSESARQALLSHSPRTRPEHVFGDMLERVPDRELQELKALEQTTLGMWEHAKEEVRLGGMTKKELADYCESFGQEYVEQILDILAGVEFKLQAYCYAHDCLCFLSPRHQCPEAPTTGKKVGSLEIRTDRHKLFRHTPPPNLVTPPHEQISHLFSLLDVS
jgi:hypothetical protein